MILSKKLFLFFKNNFTRINHWKFIHHQSHLKPFLSYLACIVHREYFSIIFNVKKCTLYSIKYGSLVGIFFVLAEEVHDDQDSLEYSPESHEGAGQVETLSNLFSLSLLQRQNKLVRLFLTSFVVINSLSHWVLVKSIFLGRFSGLGDFNKDPPVWLDGARLLPICLTI
jgi:hypothetical protein